MSKCAQEILAHNKKVLQEIARLHQEAEDLRATIIAPCSTCRQDGELRCRACEEAGYVGYNIRDFP